MGSEAAAMELEQRLKVDAPWVFEDNYGVESALFRRERIIYLYEHGHSLLSAALERDPWTKPILFDSACTYSSVSFDKEQLRSLRRGFPRLWLMVWTTQKAARAQLCWTVFVPFGCILSLL